MPNVKEKRRGHVASIKGGQTNAVSLEDIDKESTCSQTCSICTKAKKMNILCVSILVACALMTQMPLLQAAPYEEEAVMQLLESLMSQDDDDSIQLEDVSIEGEEAEDEEDGGIEEYNLADAQFDLNGCNRRWYGMIRSLPYRLRSFLRLRKLPVITVKCDGSCTRVTITGDVQADFSFCLKSKSKLAVSKI